MVNLNIAFPPTPTRFGHISANTIDIALIKNFHYPFTINSIDDLSSDHNPVSLNFNFKLAVEPPNPRAVSTDWNAFKNNLNKNLSLFDFHPNNINNTNDLEQKISEFTDAVIEAHSHASRPIEIDRRNFTPQHINRLLKLKNHLRKRHYLTLNPIFKTHYNRAQSGLKKELKKYNDSIWQKRLEALNTSLWRTQKFFKCKRPKIPPLNCATGTAVTDQQKANLLATNIKNNFIGNDSYNQKDEIINSTVNNFLSTPIEPALPDEIIHYIKHVNAKEAPDEALKPRLPDSIDHPIAVMPPSKMQNSTLAMPLIEDLSRMGLRTVLTVQKPKKATSIQRLFNLMDCQGTSQATPVVKYPPIGGICPSTEPHGVMRYRPKRRNSTHILHGKEMDIPVAFYRFRDNCVAVLEESQVTVLSQRCCPLETLTGRRTIVPVSVDYVHREDTPFH
ncbi:RNA-directed DNA polymerase from mobile element jockey [Trichonephila clavipes]|nr:RNA-directed DNA polymerase from mobile element jockey [Trichonephila clavipes]